MASLKACEQYMTTWDGTELFCRAWLPQGAMDRAVILFHRGHEHSGRQEDLVERLGLERCGYFAWDARGNGKSPGPRDWARNFAVYVKDADAFVRHVADTYGIAVQDMAVVANSVGAVIAATWVHDYAPPIRAMVLATPAFRIRLYVPLAIPALRLGLKLGLMKTVPSYVKAKVLTHDKQQQERFNEDELITHSISTNILLDVHDTSTRIIADAGAIRVPTQMHVASRDWVVKVSPQRRFFERLSSREKQLHEYPDFHHAIFHEQNRQTAIDRTREFIDRRFASQADDESLVHADESGFTKREYDLLTQPKFSPMFAIHRAGIRTLGRLSKGIRVGLRDGFDSGVMLDYVYENKPTGITPLGRLIDYFYLESIGWRGIRRRKVHLQDMLVRAINRTHESGRPAHIVDVAAGPGRYILNVICEVEGIAVTAMLRDYKQVNVDAGRRLAEQRGLGGVTYEVGDAFDREQLAALSPRPTVAIVSGLFELIPSNAPVFQTLGGLADAMDDGGCLIYTNQPWHPQVEYIARVLTNREGEPWIMRRRTQEEMDVLVRQAGFEKMDMAIDPWGIFTVSLAVRVAG